MILLRFIFVLVASAILLSAAPAFGHGGLDQQIARLTQKIEAKPTSNDLLERAELYRLHEEYPAALKDVAQSERLLTNSVLPEFTRGKILCDLGDSAGAIAALNRFLQVHPTHVQARLTRARSHSLLCQFSQAALDYEEAVNHAITPEPDHFIEWAQIQWSAGKTNEAISVLNNALTNLGSIPSVELLAIEFEVQMARWDHALQRVDRLIATSARDEQWLLQRAQILHTAGRDENARTTLRDARRAIDVLPPRFRGDAVTVALLGRIQILEEKLK